MISRFFYCTLLNKLQDLHCKCVRFSPECYAAGREGGPKEPAETTGNAKLQPSGPDSRRAETDRFFTGEQYNTADTKCQTAGTQHVISCTKQYPVDKNGSSLRNALHVLDYKFKKKFVVTTIKRKK